MKTLIRRSQCHDIVYSMTRDDLVIEHRTVRQDKGLALKMRLADSYRALEKRH